MNKENRETAGIWADHLGDAHVGCYGLLDDLKNDEATEAEIENICVDESARRTGLGQQLMEEMLQRSTTAGAEKVFLEVRSQNEPAKALYTSAGFIEQYVRKHYYREPDDDAIIMMKHLI